MTQRDDWKNRTWRPEDVTNLIGESTKMILLQSTGSQVTVHKSLLCHFSSYYAAALNSGFKETNQRLFHIDLDCNQTHGLLAWLYTGCIPDSNTMAEDDLVALWIFADKVDMLALRRDVMSRFAVFDKGYEEPVGYHALSYALSRVSESSTLYRFLIESFANHWCPDDMYPSQMREFHDSRESMGHFFYCVMYRLACFKHMEDSYKCSCSNPCNIHEHESEEEWQTTCKNVDRVEGRSFDKGRMPKDAYFKSHQTDENEG